MSRLRNSTYTFDFWLKLVMWICAMLFIAFYLTLAYNNRWVSDDVMLYNDLIEKGWWSASTEFLYSRRATSHGLFHGIIVLNTDFFSSHYQLFVYHILVLLGFISGIYRLSSTLILTNAHQRVSKSERMLFSILATAALFFGTVQLNEAWFWAISSTVHLVPMLALLHCLASIYAPSRMFFHFSVTFLLGVYIGGASELAALISLLFCSIILGQHLVRSNILKRAQLLKLSAAMIGMMITLAWNIFGKGTSARISLIENENGSNLTHYAQDFINAFSEPRNLLVVLLISLFVLLGRWLQARRVQLNFFTKRRILIAGVFLGLSFLLCYLPMRSLFGDVGPLRAWAPFSMILIGTILLIAIQVGNNVHAKERPFRILTFGTLGLISVLLATYTIRQAPIVSKYSAAHDQRITKLFELNKTHRTQVLSLDPLPDSGMLPSCDIDSDTGAWLNTEYKQVLSLGYSIRIEED